MQLGAGKIQADRARPPGGQSLQRPVAEGLGQGPQVLVIQHRRLAAFPAAGHPVRRALKRPHQDRHAGDGLGVGIEHAVAPLFLRQGRLGADKAGQHRILEQRAVQPGAGEVRRVEDGAAEVGAFQIGRTQPHATHRAVGEVGADVAVAHKGGGAAFAARQDMKGAGGVRHGDIGGAHVRLVQHRAVQRRAGQDRATQVRPPQVGRTQVRPCQVGAMQGGAFQVATGEIGAAQVGSGEVGVVQDAPAAVDAGRLDKPQDGALAADAAQELLVRGGERGEAGVVKAPSRDRQRGLFLIKHSYQ